jgi:hypothetical protein
MSYEFDIECMDKTGATYVVSVDVEYWEDGGSHDCSPSCGMDYEVTCITDEDGNGLDSLPSDIDLEELVWIQIEEVL